jgi:hypothetical protein
MAGTLCAPAAAARDVAVLYLRAEAVITAAVPRCAWFRGAWPLTEAGQMPQAEGYSLDQQTGFAVLESGHVYAVSRLDGKPLSRQEVPVLVAPGEKATYERLLPHRPVSRERAARLAASRWRLHLEEGDTLSLLRGGRYQPDDEAVLIEAFTGQADVTLEFTS